MNTHDRLPVVTRARNSALLSPFEDAKSPAAIAQGAALHELAANHRVSSVCLSLTVPGYCQSYQSNLI